MPASLRGCFRFFRLLLSRSLEPKRKHNDQVRSARMDVKSDDRLSSLPDDIIHKILSSISIKDAIGMSVLSSRWRFIWTTMPHLNFKNLVDWPHHSKFVCNVLSHRNNQTQVSSVNLYLGIAVSDNESVRTILNSASIHNIQELTVTRPPGHYPISPFQHELSVISTPTWAFPNLTTLHLHQIKLLSDDHNDSNSSGKCIGLFSKCTNLKSLFLRRCVLMEGRKVLNICHPRLSNLTLKSTPPYTPPHVDLKESVNVVAPQLKNLTIRWCAGEHLINAPELASLVIEGSRLWRISSTLGFPSLEKVDIYVHYAINVDALKLVCLLQQFRSAKLLILSLGILQHLSSSMELIQHEACVFANAKIINFTTKMPIKVYLEQHKVSTYTEIEITNCATSSRTIFPMVSREEIQAVEDMESAQRFVNDLRMLLEYYIIAINNKARMDEHESALMQLRLNLGEMIELIKQREVGALKICNILAKFILSCRDKSGTIAWLQDTSVLFLRIKGLMTQLSASKRDVMQPKFSSLCEYAAIRTTNILLWMKSQ